MKLSSTTKSFIEGLGSLFDLSHFKYQNKDLDIHYYARKYGVYEPYSFQVKKDRQAIESDFSVSILKVKSEHGIE